MLGEILFTRLTSHAATTALVAGRVYPMTMPQEPVLPAITYNEVSDDAEDGAGHIIRKRVRVIGWAESYAEAKAVGAAVLTALRGYKRVDTTPQLVAIQDDSRSDTFLPELTLYGDVIECSAWVVET